jgi:hypothetical protein
MSGKILKFGRKTKSSGKEGIPKVIFKQPVEMKTSRVLDAVKYYILVDPDISKAMQLVKYLTTTPLGKITIMPPQLATIVSNADIKKVLIVEMGGEV